MTTNLNVDKICMEKTLPNGQVVVLETVCRSIREIKEGKPVEFYLHVHENEDAGIPYLTHRFKSCEEALKEYKRYTDSSWKEAV